MLSHSNPTTTNAKQLHGVSLKVLDVYYIERPSIYEKLFELSKIDASKEQVRAAAIEEDFMLLAAAIVSASSFILERSQNELITGHLSKITKIVHGDIVNFASILIEQIFT